MYLYKETTSVKKSEMEQVIASPKDEKEDQVQTAVISSPSADEVNLDFVKYTCDTRKTAMKEGNIITISSVTQSRVRIDGFTSGRNMSGTMCRQLMLFELFRDIAIIKKKKKTETVLHIAIEFGSIEVFKYLTTYPSPKLTLALTSHLRQNCYFGEW